MEFSDFSMTGDQKALCTSVRELCARYGDDYWRKLDDNAEYPTDFVNALTEGGYLAALIPEQYGGMGLGVMDGSLILEEINRAGCNAAASHAQMYIMGTLLRHGSEGQKEAYLPGIARGEIRLQAFGVTEPDAGTDTTSITTRAEKRGGKYVVNGVINRQFTPLLCREHHLAVYLPPKT